MALPWLESLPVWGDDIRAERSSQPPVRFACLFSGNGFHSREWWARGEGARMELGKVLEPLRPFREKMLFLRGLYNQEALIGGIHSCQTGNLLTGAHLAPGGEIRSGVSCDQVIAERLGDQTKVPSLVLGCEPSIAAHPQELLDDLQLAHLVEFGRPRRRRWKSIPALAFDRLFRDEVGRADRSVLDAVIEDTRGLRNSVSRSDQRRLDEYLSSVREVEQRIERAGQAGRLQGWRPTLDQPEHAPPRRRHPAGHRPAHAAHVRHPRAGVPDRHDPRLHPEAEQRSFVAAFPESASERPNQGIDYMIHHLLSHTNGADWLKVNQFFAEQLAYIADKLNRIQEGERTLLDNSMILYCSSMMTGNHENNQLPVVMLGARRRPDPHGPSARLPGPAQPQDVQPVPVAHGQGRRSPRQFRRLARTARGDLERR